MAFVEIITNPDFRRGLCAFIIGILLLVGYHFIMKRVNPAKAGDLEIDGTIVKIHEENIWEKLANLRYKNLLPGYKKVWVQYTDFYDGKQYRYLLQKEVKIKKHPIGSIYPLHYSLEKHCVYADGENQSTKSELQGGYVFLGALLIVAGMVYMFRAFG